MPLVAGKRALVMSAGLKERPTKRGYTIGQLARVASVPTSTVRFYERNGLLRPKARSDANYRLYGASALERLLFIRAAQASGFTLHDIGLLQGLRYGRTAPCREVQKLIEERLSDLENRLRQIAHLRNVLRDSLRGCRQAERSGTCKVIDGLQATASASASFGVRPAPRKESKRSP